MPNANINAVNGPTAQRRLSRACCRMDSSLHFVQNGYNAQGVPHCGINSATDLRSRREESIFSYHGSFGNTFIMNWLRMSAWPSRYSTLESLEEL